MQGQHPDVIHALAQAIYDKKGFNILALDVRNVSSVTEYFLIAEGNVERHVQSLAQASIDKLNELGFPIFHVEGDRVGDWVVIDAGNLLVHLFLPELRQKYALEELWHNGTIVDLHIQLDEHKAKKD